MSIPKAKKYISDFEQLGFGMFVHWGLYSQLGRGEWVCFMENMNMPDYEKLMKQVLEEYGIDTHVTVSMKGSIAGDMSQYDKSEVSGRMLKMLGAKTVTTGQIQDSYVVYAYAKSVKDSVSIGKNKINVNITMNYDETRGVTDIQLSTPIYNEDF